VNRAGGLILGLTVALTIGTSAANPLRRSLVMDVHLEGTGTEPTLDSPPQRGDWRAAACRATAAVPREPKVIAANAWATASLA
jgi:hypothetical protein